MKTRFLTAALLSAGAFAAMPATAQVAGIATASPVVAIAASKAFSTANQQIGVTYKAQLDQASAKEQTKQPLLAQLDKNGDKRVDDNELAAAQAAKAPALAQIDAIDREIQTLTQPAFLAQAYALEQLTQKYDAAQTAVVAARKISVILTPGSFVYAPPSADVTQAITTQLDVTVPSVPTTPPAGWQPQRGTLQLLDQIQQLQQVAAARSASAPAAGTGTAPAPVATPGKKPAGR